MGLIQFDCEVLESTIISTKENDEIESMTFIMHEDELYIGFIDSNRENVVIQFHIENTDAIQLAKLILLNYNNSI